MPHWVDTPLQGYGLHRLGGFYQRPLQKSYVHQQRGMETGILLHEDLFSKLYDRLPKEVFFMRELLLSALWRSPEKWELAPERV